MEKLGTLSSEVVSRTEVDGRVTTVVKTQPGMKLPRVVRPVLGGKEVEFVDTRTFLARDVGALPFQQTFKTLNNITDRAQVTGTIVIDNAPFGGRGCVIKVKGECVVRITGLGSRIESIIVSNLKNAYARLPAIVDEWLAIRSARMGLGLPSTSGYQPTSSTSDTHAAGTNLLRAESNQSDDSVETNSDSDSAGSFHSAGSFESAASGSGRSVGDTLVGTRGGENSGYPTAASTATHQDPSTPGGGVFSETPPDTAPASFGTPAGSGLTPHFFTSDSPAETPTTRTPPFGVRTPVSVTNNPFLDGSPVAGLVYLQSPVKPADIRDEDIDSADERQGVAANRGGLRNGNGAVTSAAAATGSRGAYFGISASASPYAQTVRSSEHAGGGHLSRAGKSSSGGTLGAIARWCCCAQSLPGSPLLDEPGSSEIRTMRGGTSSDSLASPSPIGRAVSDPANENWDEENDLRTPLTPGGKTKRRMRR